MLPSSISYMNVAQLYSLSQSKQIRVPVAADNAAYSNFSHITGVVDAAAVPEKGNVSLNKLYLIDRLIQKIYDQQKLKNTHSEDTARFMANIKNSIKGMKEDQAVSFLEQHLDENTIREHGFSLDYTV